MPAGILAIGLALSALPTAGLPAFYESFLYLVFSWIALATSWSILSGYAGYFSFGHGAFFGAGMYTTATLAAGDQASFTVTAFDAYHNITTADVVWSLTAPLGELAHGTLQARRAGTTALVVSAGPVQARTTVQVQPGPVVRLLAGPRYGVHEDHRITPARDGEHDGRVRTAARVNESASRTIDHVDLGGCGHWHRSKRRPEVGFRRLEGNPRAWQFSPGPVVATDSRHDLRGLSWKHTDRSVR